MYLKFLAALSAVTVLAGCGAGEQVNFAATKGQTPIVRDGRPAIVSQMARSVVILSPAGRGLQPGTRPVYVVAATNLTGKPIDLRISDITVEQVTPSGSTMPLQVITFEQLVQEERARQIMAAVLVGAAAAANSYSAANAGRGSYSGTVQTRSGVRTFNGTYYDPSAAAFAQTTAAIQNGAMIGGTIEAGRRNLDALEQGVLKDNTILPREWVGGQLHFAPPEGEYGKMKVYTISIVLGGERHTFKVTQGQAAAGA